MKVLLLLHTSANVECRRAIHVASLLDLLTAAGATVVTVYRKEALQQEVLTNTDAIFFEDPYWYGTVSTIAKKHTLSVWYAPMTFDVPFQLKNYFNIDQFLCLRNTTWYAMLPEIKARAISVEWLYTPVANKVNTKRKLIYYLSDADRDLQLARTITGVLNTYIDCDITVIGPKKSLSLISKEVNDHIRLSAPDPDHPDMEADLLIGDEYYAQLGLHAGVPVIVAGKYGLGCLVHLQNYKTLMQYNCNGRPGGYYDEPIPADVLNYDIKQAIEQPETAKATAEKISGLLSAAKSELAERFGQTLHGIFEMSRRRKEDFHNVHFKLSPHIYLKRLQQNQEWILQQTNGKLLVQIDMETAQIMQALKKGSTCSQIAEGKGMDVATVSDLLQQLYKESIIYMEPAS